MLQKTVEKPISFEGVGIHSGKRVRMTILPAPVNCGIVFVRTYLPNTPRIPANINYLFPQARNTALKSGEAKIQTVEHVLAVLAGLGITNVWIEIDAEEPPILDGSGLPLVAGLREVLIIPQNKNVPILELKQPVFVQEAEATIVALPSEKLKIFCYLEFPGTAIGRQVATFEEDEDFVELIAPARTFGFWNEIENLKTRGLALGGSVDNALIVGEKVYSTTLRLSEEPARHKILDLMGDLSLLGQFLKANIIALRPGHHLNCQLIKKISTDISEVSAIV